MEQSYGFNFPYASSAAWTLQVDGISLDAKYNQTWYGSSGFAYHFTNGGGYTPGVGGDAQILKYSGNWTAVKFNDHIGAYNDSLVKQLQADPKRKVVIPNQAEIDAVEQRAFKEEAERAKSVKAAE